MLQRFPKRSLVLAIGITVFCSACASLTPGMKTSGYRPGDKHHGRNIDERVVLKPLTTAQLYEIKRKLWEGTSSPDRGGPRIESFAADVAAFAAKTVVSEVAKAIAKDIECAAERHVQSYGATIWRSDFYENPGSNSTNLGGFIVRRELNFGEGTKKRDDDLVAACQEHQVAEAGAKEEQIRSLCRSIWKAEEEIVRDGFVQIDEVLENRELPGDPATYCAELAGEPELERFVPEGEAPQADTARLRQQAARLEKIREDLNRVTRKRAAVEKLVRGGDDLWCPVMSVVFEIGHERERERSASDYLDESTHWSDAALENNYFQIRPVEHTLDLLRTKAKVIDPTGWVPWTWCTNEWDNTWFAPTKGKKDYLDELSVELQIQAVYTDLTGAAHSREDALLFDETYEFERVLIGKASQTLSSGKKHRVTGRLKKCEKAATNERWKKCKGNLAWSEPIPLPPRTHVPALDTSHQQIRFEQGNGVYVVTAKVIEADSGGEVLGKMSDLLDKNRKKGAKWVSKEVEDALDDDDDDDDKEEPVAEEEVTPTEAAPPFESPDDSSP